ncbi:MAG: DM13 domain-containing protein [Deltaproteobacteria bacterium]
MKTIIILIVLIVLIIAWYLFRPEKLFISSKINEDFPNTGSEEKGAPEIISQGEFHGVAHEGEGLATIYDMGDGHRVLRFTDFAVSNGPDVHVYLVSAEDPKDSKEVKESDIYELGSIKGNVGNQNYGLGPDVELSKYKSVVIWCKRFGVNFAVATLKPE